jgi:hypothetical protein
MTDMTALSRLLLLDFALLRLHVAPDVDLTLAFDCELDLLVLAEIEV